ncbi:hypothetical protein [Methylobacterium nigriterrae]|uniref:hypothetical protein n=1 Tax=Methylobacterium nigriterrae TaxID=3127512 RepID=UPI0030138220
MKTLRMAVAAAALGCFMGMPSAEAAQCRPGKLYRPSRGICVTEAAFRRDVGRVHRHRATRHAGRRHERVKVVYVERKVPVYVEREAPHPAPAEAAKAPAGPVKAPAESVKAPVAATQTAAAVPPAPVPPVASPQAAAPAMAEARPPEAEVRTIAAAIPFETVGKQSLNPLPPRSRGWEWVR